MSTPATSFDVTSSMGYPPEHSFFKRSFAVSLGTHLSILIIIGIIAYFSHIKTLQQLMLEGGQIAQSGPAPEQEMQVVLAPDDTPPPPPVTNPDFAREIVKPPPPPPVQPPKPKVQKPPTPTPKYTAPDAHGAGETETATKLVVGTSGCPKPNYPPRALQMRLEGTVVISIQFDSAGGVSSDSVSVSSGVPMLDEGARKWILSNWHTPLYAGKTMEVPIQFSLSEPN